MLDKKTLEKIKKELEIKKEKLEQKLTKVARKNEDGTWEAKYIDEERDPETNANEVEDWLNESSVVEVLVKDLKNVEAALQKIADGTYGRCEICGKEISQERLLAFPEARTCSACAHRENAL